MARTRHTPQWVYESLPYLYLGAGLVVMLGLANVWGIISGLILASAGVVVFMMRRQFRKALRDKDAQLEKLRAMKRARLVKLAWRDGYATGRDTIDAQHRGLFDMANRLLADIQAGASKAAIRADIDTLLDDIQFHFRTEEQLMAETGFPFREEHAQEHIRLLSKAVLLQEQYGADEIDVEDVFAFISGNVVAQHIATEDLKFVAHLNAAG